MSQAYEYWLSEPDPLQWFMNETGLKSAGLDLNEIFEPISHRRLNELSAGLAKTSRKPFSKAAVARLAAMPGFGELADHYEKVPTALTRAAKSKDQADHWPLFFSFHIMNISGLSAAHEPTLREVNRSLAGLIGRENPGQVQELIARTFRILKESARGYPRTALNTVLNMGKAVYKTDESDLVEFFLTSVVELGFQTPAISGVGDDWQVRANEAHVHNIRVWLELIEQNPRWSKRLLSALIIELSMGGIFIKDTDLFPRDITGLLNADIEPVYNLVKQLCRIFPAYFNEIGAEGRLRDTSTSLDELLNRRDRLIHFLRKQAHVESSSRTVTLIEGVMQFWRTQNTEHLAGLVPPGIYGQIEKTGPTVDGLRVLMNLLFDSGTVSDYPDLLTAPSDKVAAIVAPRRKGVTKQDRKRLELTIELYRMLYQKYHTDTVNVGDWLDQYRSAQLPDLSELKKALALTDPGEKLESIFGYMEKLKALILSPEAHEIQEDIYHKRHIAADIPSMYGWYHEAKFDALGLTFRLEPLVNRLLQDLIDSLDLTLITRATFIRILRYLRLFHRALRLDGIHSREMEHQLDLLAHSVNIRGFSFTQFMDIFTRFAEVVSNIVNDNFNNIHQNQLTLIVAGFQRDDLLPKYKPQPGGWDDREMLHRTGEIFPARPYCRGIGLAATGPVCRPHQHNHLPAGPRTAAGIASSSAQLRSGQGGRPPGAEPHRGNRHYPPRGQGAEPGPAQQPGPAHSAGVHPEHRSLPFPENHRFVRPGSGAFPQPGPAASVRSGKADRPPPGRPRESAAAVGAQRVVGLPAGHDGHFSERGA